MDFELFFIFRNNLFYCAAIVDASAEPCYVFVELKDSLLIQEFGDEVTIKTDFEKRLPKKDDIGELVALRQAVFDALKDHPQFRGARRHRFLTRTGLVKSTPA